MPGKMRESLTIRLSRLYLDTMERMIEAGLYSSKSEMVREALRLFFEKHGVRIPYKTKFSKKAVAWMKEQSLGFMDDAILRSDLALLGVLDEQIGFVEEKLAAHAVDDTQVRLLMTMTGVDYFAAMLVLAEMARLTGSRERRVSAAGWGWLRGCGSPVRRPGSAALVGLGTRGCGG